MVSARSALNWLLTQHHSIARVADPNTAVAVAKLSTRDATVQLALDCGIRTAKEKNKKLAKRLPPSSRKRKQSQALEPNDSGDDDDDDDGGGDGDDPVRQTDPLAGKIRESLPDENLSRAMKW